MNRDKRKFCLTNLIDIIDICGEKKISKLEKERICVKANAIYKLLESNWERNKRYQLNKFEFCMAYLSDILKICKKEKISRLENKKIYIRAGTIYEILEG